MIHPRTTSDRRPASPTPIAPIASAWFRRKAGHLWVGTTEGLDLFDPSSGQFNHYRHDASDAESLRDSYVMSLYEDQTGMVWIAMITA